MKITPQTNHQAGFTLAEVVMSAAITALTLGGVIYAYINSAKRAEYAAFSLAAQSAAILRIEQTRAARWDRESVPVVDQLQSSNFPPQAVDLDLPTASGILSRGTNYTTITLLGGTSPTKAIRVDCVWKFTTGKVFTNTIVTLRAPDT